jgi:hypothetical protein
MGTNSSSVAEAVDTQQHHDMALITLIVICFQNLGAVSVMGALFLTWSQSANRSAMWHPRLTSTTAITIAMLGCSERMLIIANHVGSFYLQGRV